MNIILIILAYLYCPDCKKLICDKCKIDSHSTHAEVKDQVLALEEVFLRMKEFIVNFKESYKQIEENSNKINFKLGSDLDEYFEEEKKLIEKDNEFLKKIIDDIKQTEIDRLVVKINSGKDSIKDYMAETKYIKDIYTYCNSNMEKRHESLENFKNNTDVEEKIKILAELQKMSNELQTNNEKIKQVLNKLQSIDNYNVKNILNINKDHTYSIYISKFQRILKLKLEKMKEKLKQESEVNKYLDMEKIKKQLEECKVYKKELNLSSQKNKKIYQAVDDTDTILEFNYEDKTITKQKAVFNNEVLQVLKSNKFPRFARSINIENKLFISGGEINKEVTSVFLEVDENFNVKLNKDMCFKRSGHTLLNISNAKLFAISGAYEERSCEYFDFKDKDNIWKFFPPLKDDRVGPSVMVYNDDIIFCFFGKRFDMGSRKWEFITSVEKINLIGNKHKMWNFIVFKNTITENLVNRAFGGTICLPNNKVLILGGQIFENYELNLCYDSIEIDLEALTISPSSVKVPKKVAFLDSCFYYCNNNVIQFDNVGDIFLYSIVYNEFGYIES